MRFKVRQCTTFGTSATIFWILLCCQNICCKSDGDSDNAVFVPADMPTRETEQPSGAGEDQQPIIRMTNEIPNEVNGVPVKSPPQIKNNGDSPGDNDIYLDKKHMGSAMSGWLNQVREGRSDGNIDIDKKHLGSAMSGWLKQAREGRSDGNIDIDKKHLGSAMSGWLKQNREGRSDGNIDIDKKHLGSAMSGWLKQTREGRSDGNIDIDKKHLGSAMSGWLKQTREGRSDGNIDIDKKHLGSAMSGWLKQIRQGRSDEGTLVEKKHLGAATSWWLKKFRNDRNVDVNKKNIGSAISGAMKTSQMADSHSVSKRSIEEYIPYFDEPAQAPNKRHLGAAINRGRHLPADLSLYMSGYQPEHGQRQDINKRHLGSAMSSWLAEMTRRRNKRHFGSAASSWLKEFTGPQKKDFEPEIVGDDWRGLLENSIDQHEKVKRHIGSIAKQNHVPFPMTKYSPSRYVRNRIVA